MSAVRYYLTYAGRNLPVRLLNPVDENDLANRNTFIRARYDDLGRLIEFEKMVYGEIELTHTYQYDDRGMLRFAEISMGGERNIVKFD